ncbi:caspase family protein [Herbaspirillum rubrisubalbicans]|uniref:caspase family protein n=1 Tax=Herbaspirillum rubrisubalbicans TaxID=80842 RepID=UPI000DD2D3E0|nr:caspase family protein [Herbaspirillum rubrisubalbicans]
MKRKALLIGNTGGLEGVAIDLQKMSKFLRSPLGGEWSSSEIFSGLDPTRARTLALLEQIKSEKVDYFLFLFTGHGSHYGQTYCNLNEKNEKLLESDLNFIADRQLSIFDCCRVIDRTVTASVEELHEAYDSATSTRQRYDARIMSTPNQHVSLYSCSEGQSSYDSPRGAIYFGNLLDSAKAIGDAPWRAVEEVHKEAKVLTSTQCRIQGRLQTPQAVLPKLMPAQQLILSIR